MPIMRHKRLPLALFAAALTAVTSLTPAAQAAQTDDPAADQAATSGSADRFVLVEDGQSQSPIILFEDAPPKTLQAAKDLASYIEKISGAKPELMKGAPESIPDHAIWVGVQPRVKQLFPEIDFDFKHPEEIVIAANQNHLVIAGRDKWDPDHLNVSGRDEMIKGYQHEYGTANAIYTFLHKYLDVIWLWPGQEDIRPTRTIALDLPFETYRYHPQFRQRATLFRLSQLGNRHGQSEQWTRFQRLQLDSLYMRGNHAFTDWWKRFHKTKPDLFAVQPDGDRSGWPGPHEVKLDVSNPDVWDQWLADVKMKIKKKPQKRVFNATENDSSNQGICMGPDCMAWDPSPSEASPYTYLFEGDQQQFKRKKYVPMSDRYVRFSNKVARKLKKAYPDKNYYVGQFAYHTSRAAPVHARDLEDNIIMSFIGYFPTTTQNKRQKEKQQYRDWAKIAPMMIYRPNLWVYFGSLQVPQIALQKTVEDWRFLAKNNCVGIFIDTIWESWATKGPQYYLMAQLTWNPNVDARAKLSQYYKRGFGPAAPQIRDYWQMMERESDALDYRARIGEVLEKRFSDRFLDKAEGLLRQAAQQVEGGPKKYQQRVAYVRAGLDYTRLMFELVPLMKKADNGDDQALARARDHWDKIRQINKDHPHALNMRSLSRKANQRKRHLRPTRPDEARDQGKKLLPP